MKRRVHHLLIALLCSTAISGFGQDTTIRVLPADFNADKENQMVRAYLRKQVHPALDRRLERLEGLETEEQIGEYQDRLRKFFRETVGLETFERSPLKAEVTGRLDRDGYAVEKVIFESQPGFHVTGNLYLPSSPGPHPAILHACGHTDNGKANDTYQKVNILLVKQGFVVLCYDPIGQGERKQLLDKSGKPLRGGSGEHMALGVAPILLGRGLSSYMIWDGMRSIDFLQSRPEVDPERIGCTGNSGGGNMTSYLMALDERIQVAAPGCFMTTTRMKNESPGPGDAEQNLFAQIREGLDHPDFAIIRAPKPTLILAATHDFVPIEGTWDAFRQGKRIYTKLGFPERIDLVEAPEKHGFSKRLREGAARFFCRWLKNKNVEVVEPEEVAVEKEADLLCTRKGQAMMLEGERSMLDLNAELAEELALGRREAWQKKTAEERRRQVREATGIRELSDLDEPNLRVQDIVTGPHRSFSLKPEEGIEIPGVIYEEEPNLNSFGVLDAPFPEESPAGVRFAVHIRDLGETRTRNWRFYGADAFIAYMLGRSYLAMRTEDVLVSARAFRTHGTRQPLNLHAWGEAVPPAIHAAALEPELFESVTLHGGITTWQTVIESRDPMPHFHNIIHGALRHYDLADLIEMIPAGKLKIEPE